VARYQVESRPEGPGGRLEVLRPDLAPPDLRSWLADRLEALRTFPGRSHPVVVAFGTRGVAKATKTRAAELRRG
jgi:hypothetical protein